MSSVAIIVVGYVKTYSLSERGMTVKVRVDLQRTLVLEFDLQRLDFMAQLRTIQSILASNEERTLRAANNFVVGPERTLWIALDADLPTDWDVLTAAGTPPVVSPIATASGEGSLNPFDMSAAQF